MTQEWLTSSRGKAFSTKLTMNRPSKTHSNRSVRSLNQSLFMWDLGGPAMSWERALLRDYKQRPISSIWMWMLWSEMKMSVKLRLGLSSWAWFQLEKLSQLRWLCECWERSFIRVMGTTDLFSLASQISLSRQRNSRRTVLRSQP